MSKLDPPIFNFFNSVRQVIAKDLIIYLIKFEASFRFISFQIASSSLSLFVAKHDRHSNCFSRGGESKERIGGEGNVDLFSPTWKFPALLLRSPTS